MTLPAEVTVVWRSVPEGVDRRTVSRALLAEQVPGATFVSRCPRCGGSHGRVQVVGADATVSVSYAEGWAVVAVDSLGRRVGVDAVPASASGLDRVLPGGDARSWARVEAVLKVDGRGLTVDPLRVRFADEAVPGTAWTASIDDGATIVGWDVAGPSGVILAVAADLGAAHPR